MKQTQQDTTRETRLEVMTELLREASEYELDLILRFTQTLLGDGQKRQRCRF